MIRPATIRDLDAVIELGLEALNTDPYEGLVISLERVRGVAHDCIAGSSHFCWVAETDGVVTGAVTVFVQDWSFYERKQASVVQFYCNGPSAGHHLVALIKAMMEWADGRRIIKGIVFTLEYNVDARIERLLERFGFSISLPVYMRLR